MIHLIGEKLHQVGCTVTHAEGDADFVIAKTALQMAASSSQSVILIGEDTDLLILLYHHADEEQVVFRSDVNKTKKIRRVSDIQARKASFQRLEDPSCVVMPYLVVTQHLLCMEWEKVHC